MISPIQFLPKQQNKRSHFNIIKKYGCFDPESLVTKLQELVKQREIYRVKGFVNVPHKPMRLVLQGVGNRFDSFYDRLWLNTDVRETRLVFIGKQLESDFLEKALSKNMARSNPTRE